MADTDDSKPGRRFKLLKVDELQAGIKAYFDGQDPHTEKQLRKTGTANDGSDMWKLKEVLTEQKPYTVTGLARALGVDRNTLRNYKNPNHYPEDIDPELRQDLISTIEDAFWRIEEHNEEELHKSGLANGIKFNLVNNFNWQDKHVVDQTNRQAEADLDALDAKDELNAGRDELADAADKAITENSEAADNPADAGVKPPEPTDDPGPTT